MNNRRVLLIAAGVLAVFGVLAFVLLAAQSRPSGPPPRNVVVAARDISPKTRLSRAMFTIAQKPADQVDPTALSSLDQIDGNVSQAPIGEGGVVTAIEIAPVSSLGLSVQLRQGMRAISIPVDQVKGVSDLLHPGDRVDVIASPPRNGTRAAAFTIMRNIVVLSVGQMFAAPVATAAPPGSPPATPAPDVRTVTLEVTPTQADLITMADLNTTIRLSLRPPNEPATSGMTEHVVFFDSTPPPPTPVQAAAPAAPAPAAPAKPSYSVPVIDGDKMSGGSR